MRNRGWGWGVCKCVLRGFWSVGSRLCDRPPPSLEHLTSLDCRCAFLVMKIFWK